MIDEHIYDTNQGEEIKERINDLQKLLQAYRDGNIKERDYN